MSEMREKMKLKKWKIHSQGRLKDSTLHNFPDCPQERTQISSEIIQFYR